MEHAVRKAVDSRQAYAHRRKTLAWGILLAVALAAALIAFLVA